MDGYGWIWMDMDGYGWIWMDMDGYEWIWMDRIQSTSIHQVAHGSHVLPRDPLVQTVNTEK